MDYQRAVQAYIGATPVLNSMGWRAGLARFGVDEKNKRFLVFQDSALPQHVIMTTDQVAPYAWSLMDLKGVVATAPHPRFGMAWARPRRYLAHTGCGCQCSLSTRPRREIGRDQEGQLCVIADTHRASM